MFKQKTKDMEELLKQLEAAKSEVSRIRTALHKLKDGYIYVTSLQVLGSEYWDVHTNQFPVEELQDEYYSGENGILTVYTNNPELSEWASVHSIEELKTLHYKVAGMIDAL